MAPRISAHTDAAQLYRDATLNTLFLSDGQLTNTSTTLLGVSLARSAAACIDTQLTSKSLSIKE